MSEYFKWHCEPTSREILDAHLANIASILINTNSKRKVKAQDLMILITEEDKKANDRKILANEVKQGFARFKHKTKKK